MTTITDKSVFRVTRAAYTVLHHSKYRQIVLGIEPGDLVTCREKGRRKRWSITADDLFHFLVRKQAEADRRKKIEERKARRKNRS